MWKLTSIRAGKMSGCLAARWFNVITNNCCSSCTRPEAVWLTTDRDDWRRTARTVLSGVRSFLVGKNWKEWVNQCSVPDDRRQWACCSIMAAAFLYTFAFYTHCTGTVVTFQSVISKIKSLRKRTVHRNNRQFNCRSNYNFRLIYIIFYMFCYCSALRSNIVSGVIQVSCCDCGCDYSNVNVS